MKHPPQITGAEWEIMEVVWRAHPVTSNRVVDELESRMAWKPNTVRTLLARLVKKGALTFSADGNSYLYKPCFTRQQHVGRESDSFLARVFGGATTGLLIHFAETGRLTEADVKKLKKILKQSGE
jgi:BlaI family penicillinase repressor